MEGFKKPSVLEANLFYLVLGFSLLILGYLVQTRELYSGLLITEYVLILLPSIIYVTIRGYSLREVLKLNPINLKQTLFIVLIMIFAYPVVVFLNAIFLTIISSFSSAIPTTVPIPTTPTEFIKGLFVIALAPGICEEVMFRGVMMSSYDKFGYKKSILITALLFGMFHFNIMNLIGPIFLGIILGILRYKTNSIWSSMIGHTLNNGIALTIGYMVTIYAGDLDELASSSVDFGSTTEMIISLISIGAIALFSLGILILLIKKLPSADRSFDIYEFTEISFRQEKSGFLKYIPLMIILVTFIILNYQLLFYV